MHNKLLNEKTIFTNSCAGLLTFYVINGSLLFF